MVSLSKAGRHSQLTESKSAARRQAEIRSAWSTTERRERAWQAAAQMGALWALISGQPVNQATIDEPRGEHSRELIACQK